MEKWQSMGYTSFGEWRRASERAKEGGAVTSDCPVDAGTVIACASTTFASVRSSSLILPAHCRSREAAAARTAGSIAASHVRRCTPVAYGKGYALAERDTLCLPALFHLVAHMSHSVVAFSGTARPQRFFETLLSIGCTFVCYSSNGPARPCAA